MKITLNGHAHDCKGALTLSDLIESLALANQKLAIEVNLEIIPRSQYSNHTLNDGDQIEIVHAIGGG